ncbi:MAG: prolipoprotein diacylglyceryl transferase [Oceanospirillaceae bacterium]|nr:prolipoprotein diacylglyceryl transferase [Oceanospirillaceae bacterium]HCI02418.1 prolipoprotein diacylglyceryl transferase [Oceanospirillaceae bacterium]|tara:strand:- start:247 stop:1014 length:768 start_codon:yes stop_codon:yes gene_type:complete
MLTYPNIDPIALQLGPISIHWYGIMYMLAFVSAWWLAMRRASIAGFSKEQVSDIIFYGAIGVVLGGRIGYILFYQFGAFIKEPSMILRVWEGGMSFHGGLIGVILAVIFCARRQQRSFASIMDFVAPIVPLGLGAGRLGNFIGGELWGRPTELPWGMVFPHVDQLARHPSQLYQFALEGIFLFILVWLYSAKPRANLQVSGMFLLGYGGQRLVVEFARQPDAHLNFIAFGWLTQGQLLSMPMIALGLYLLLRKAR